MQPTLPIEKFRLFKNFSGWLNNLVIRILPIHLRIIMPLWAGANDNINQLLHDVLICFCIVHSHLVGKFATTDSTPAGRSQKFSVQLQTNVIVTSVIMANVTEPILRPGHAVSICFGLKTSTCTILAWSI